MSEDVRGWCLGKDSAGVPTLSECAVMRGVEGRYFAEMVDSQGNAITVRTYQRGETFFTDYVQALEVLRDRLATEVNKHQMKVLYLARQLEKTKGLIELEEEAGDEGR